MTGSVDELAAGLRRSVPVKEVAVWLETWVSEDSAASHYYPRFARGTVGLNAHQRAITRPVTAADTAHLAEGYRVGDPTSRFDSVRHAVVAAVTKARERWGDDVLVRFGAPYCAPAFSVPPGVDPATCEIDAGVKTKSFVRQGEGWESEKW